jgi:hypothetical protein
VQSSTDPILLEGHGYVLFLKEPVDPEKAALGYFNVSGSGNQFGLTSGILEPALEGGWSQQYSGRPVDDLIAAISTALAEQN